MKLKIYLPILAAIFAAVLGGSVAAESFNYRFDVKLGIVKIGEMKVAANYSTSSYSTGAILITTGVVGAIHDVRYDFSATGKIGDDGALIPAKHTSISDEKGRVTTLNIHYNDDRVSSVTYDPARSVPSNVTTFSGTVDPMSLIYLLLRPVKSADACTGNYVLFDGNRRSTVTYKNVRRLSNGRVECDISYSNTGGGGGIALSALVFVPQSNGMVRIEEFSANTNVGSLTVRLQ